MRTALIGLTMVFSHSLQATTLWDECELFLSKAGSPGLRKAVIEVERTKRQRELYEGLSKSTEIQFAILKRKYGWRIVFLRFGRSTEATNFRKHLRERTSVWRNLAQLTDQQADVLEAYERAVSSALADWARKDFSRFETLQNECRESYRLARSAAEETERVMAIDWVMLNATSFSEEWSDGLSAYSAAVDYGPVRDRVKEAVLRLEEFERALIAAPNAAELKPIIVYVAGQREALAGASEGTLNFQRQWDILHGVEMVTQAMGGARD